MTNLRISLLGAPGSGKTSVAAKLAVALRKEGKTVKVVDKYVDRLRARIPEDINAFDIHATYPQNLQIQFERWTKEQEAERAGCDVLITCGSIYETILYTALRINSDLTLGADKELQSFGRVAMECLGVVQTLTSISDLLFFLPYSEKVQKTKGKSYDTVINDKLPEVVGGYYRPLTILQGPTTEKKVIDAVSAVKSVEEWKAGQSTVDEEPTV
jgi:hypothetical protein